MQRPLLFMHVPKTGGSALIHALLKSVPRARSIRGFDRALFGDFRAFETMAAAERARVFLETSDLPPGADLVVAHMAMSTLQAAYPAGQLVTILREPVSRLLSHWSYWRSRDDADLAEVGAWGNIVRSARAPLADFLSNPQAACQTDNVVTRMLLWPHALIANDGFIDPRHDALIIRVARKRLEMFSAVDIAESPGHPRLLGWLGLRLADERVNETFAASAETRVRLAAELDCTALARLDACSRLDLQLWRDAAGAQMDERGVDRLRSATLLVNAARHAALLGGG